MTGDATMAGTLGVDTINEKTNNTGVTIEGVLLKDNNIDAANIDAGMIDCTGTVSSQSFDIGSINVISALRQVVASDLTAASGNFTVDGSTGNTDISGTLSVDTITEKATNSGVTIENVLLKDGTVDAGMIDCAGTVSTQSLNIGNINVVSALRQVTASDLTAASGNFR